MGNFGKQPLRSFTDVWAVLTVVHVVDYFHPPKPVTLEGLVLDAVILAILWFARWRQERKT